ncbi:hypothetical protein ACFSM7_04905 [Clavibacter michiganensis subsp. tessellarius]|uniref:hypothetical protein n=1 Tax=Clavibacter tessellarius TaxID=31965 RepID=UPI00362BE932
MLDGDAGRSPCVRPSDGSPASDALGRDGPAPPDAGAPAAHGSETARRRCGCDAGAR